MKRPFLIVTLVLALACLGAYGQKTTTSTLKKKQASLSSTLKKVKAQKSQLQAKLRQQAAASNKMMADIHRVDSRMNQLDEKIEQTQHDLEQGKATQAKLAKELKEKSDELDAVKKQVAVRIRAIYTQGTAAPVTILVSSHSLSELAVRKALVERIADKDRELFDKMKELRDAVLDKKKEQDRVVAKITELTRQQQAQMNELEQVRAEKKKVFSVLKAAEEETEDELEDMIRESHKLEAQIADIQAKTSGQVPVFRGRFINPVPGARRSSGFGSRRHPISGRTKMHTGVDLAAPSGTPIKAAGAGKVITAAYLNGYGNTIVIDHGGGVSTLYGHCSRLYARVGQNVSTGDRIAAVGSTGYSTGPHCHFEVRINGRPVNPMGRF